MEEASGRLMARWEFRGGGPYPECGGAVTDYSQYVAAAAALTVWCAFEYWPVVLFVGLVLGVIGMVAAALNGGQPKKS